MAVTETLDDDPLIGVTAAVPQEDAYILSLLMRDFENQKAWEGGRPWVAPILRSGEFLLRDLKRGQTVLIDKPHHSIHFYLPRSALDQIGQDCEAVRVDELRYRPGQPVDDVVVRSLGGSLRPAFNEPSQTAALFVEHVTIALCMHVAERYGGMKPRLTVAVGGLSKRQLNQAQAMLMADLSGEVSVRDVANACGLSLGHFIRAFKQSLGAPPYQWLMHQRIQMAKSQLHGSRLSIAEIAGNCGFADQSHFTRLFARSTGAPPGRWRRQSQS